MRDTQHLCGRTAVLVGCRGLTIKLKSPEPLKHPSVRMGLSARSADGKAERALHALHQCILFLVPYFMMTKSPHVASNIYIVSTSFWRYKVIAADAEQSLTKQTQNHGVLPSPETAVKSRPVLLRTHHCARRG